jgi:hypothetical protein
VISAPFHFSRRAVRLSAMRHAVLFLATLACCAPAKAQTDLERGFAGALRGCEEWVLNPASWAHGVGPFVSTVGLGNKMALVDSVDEATLPPKELRQGDRYWRINSTARAGYVLVVSDQLPMCHITGGGTVDLRPTVEAVITSPDFAKRWERLTDLSKGEMASTQFRNREDPALFIVVSRAKLPGQRLDRVQVLATATYRLGK